MESKKIGVLSSVFFSDDRELGLFFRRSSAAANKYFRYPLFLCCPTSFASTLPPTTTTITNMIISTIPNETNAAGGRCGGNGRFAREQPQGREEKPPHFSSAER